MQMNETATGRLYDLWAKIYDGTFGRLVHKRQERAINQIRPRPGDRVLDIGVGTGMTLQHYPATAVVIGMDLSGGMLAKAIEKARELDLHHCHLVQADAMNPPFAAQSFDHILISHTISVVSDPRKLVHWASRLIKPGGRIVILNHFLSGNPLVAWWERITNPIFVKIGWRSDLSLEECLRGVDMRVQYRFKLSQFDFWQIVVLTAGKDRDAPPAPAEAMPAAHWALETR